MTLRPCLVPFAIVAAASLAFANPAPQGSGLSNATVLIIRHGEKPADGTGLTPRGKERATAYAKYFQNYKVGSSLFHADYLLATADSKKSARERLTLEPLGQSFGLPVESKYKNNQYAQVISDIQARPAGKSYVICWHHGNIPNLIRSFGVQPEALLPSGKWPAAQFGWVIQIKFDAAGKPIRGLTKRVQENLTLSNRM
ncbi:MAG: hypothetical protein P4L46_18080 [Fimbriimonas sp.]|nr:hypothetical protein [Fimbriimonas sp.]